MTYRVRIDRVRRLDDNSIAIEYTEGKDSQIGIQRSKRGLILPAMTRNQVARAMEESYDPEQMILIALTDWLGTTDPLRSLEGKVVTVDATTPVKITTV